ncbi:MAG: DUF4924 family protein [Prevotella sp.]|nr:DUF4924 family protein [Candidatus Equicola stercoris]
MFIADNLRKTNIAEYLLYMWQIEDIMRAYDCDMIRIRREYLSRFNLNEEQLDEEETWWRNLVRMMKEEGKVKNGHLQINMVTLQMLCELNDQLLNSPKYPFYLSQYYKVLPFIVELRRKGKTEEVQQNTESEIETCFDALYGTMMLKLQKKNISTDTEHAMKEITTFIGMLNDYYFKDKETPLEF